MESGKILSDKSFKYLDKSAILAIEKSLKCGNNVEVRRKGDGVIIQSVKKTIQYSTSA